MRPTISSVPRRLLILAALALAAAFLGYGLTRLAVRPPAAEHAASPAAQLAWLEREFRLTRAACEEIARLQAAYAPVCEQHCADIARAQAALRAARADSAPAAVVAAENELVRLKQVCADSTRAHLHAVAAQMPPAQAARFLDMMEPRIAHDDARQGAPAFSPAPAPAAP